MDQEGQKAKTGQQENFVQSENLQSEPSNKTDESTAVSFLNDCYNELSHPVSDEATAKELAAIAQALIDSFNKKRKNDSQLFYEYRIALENHTKKMVQVMEEQVYRLHEVQNGEVNVRIQALFSRLDNITTSQNDLDKFKASLRSLYEDMHGAN